MISGRQYLAFVSGGIMRGAFMRHAGRPKITIMGLAAHDRGATVVKLSPFEKGSSALYSQLCALCHGPGGRGTDAPALRGNPVATDFRLLSEVIKHPGIGMPAYYPDVVSDEGHCPIGHAVRCLDAIDPLDDGRLLQHLDLLRVEP